MERQHNLGVVETIDVIGGVLFRTIYLPEPGLRIPQHVHDYDHANVCISGRARLFVDGVETRLVGQGDIVEMRAGHQHEFESLESDTRLMCAHSEASAESIKKAGL